MRFAIHSFRIFSLEVWMGNLFYPFWMKKNSKSITISISPLMSKLIALTFAIYQGSSMLGWCCLNVFVLPLEKFLPYLGQLLEVFKPIPSFVWLLFLALNLNGILLVYPLEGLWCCPCSPISQASQIVPYWFSPWKQIL